MPNYQLLNLASQLRAIGRAAVFYAPYWGGVSPLALTQLGDTEGAIAPEPNDEYSTLALTELTGPAPVEKYATGAAPTVDLPMYVDESILGVLSPDGNPGAGRERWRRVTKWTVALIPEDLLLGPNGKVPLAYTSGGGWTKDGNPLTAAEQQLLGLSLWAWRAHFSKTIPSYRAEDGGKAMLPATLHMMQDFTKPDGQQLYTVGDPADSNIDIDPAPGT